MEKWMATKSQITNKGKGINMVLDKLATVLGELQVALKDAEKFDRGNASAGVRLRKQAQAAVRALKEVRKVVSDVKSERKAAKPPKQPKEAAPQA